MTSSLPLLLPAAIRFPLSSMDHTELSQSPDGTLSLSMGGAGGVGGVGGSGVGIVVGGAACSLYAFCTRPPKSNPQSEGMCDASSSLKLVSMSAVRSGWSTNRAGRVGLRRTAYSLMGVDVVQDSALGEESGS